MRTAVDAAANVIGMTAWTSMRNCSGGLLSWSKMCIAECFSVLLVEADCKVVDLGKALAEPVAPKKIADLNSSEFSYGD